MNSTINFRKAQRALFSSGGIAAYLTLASSQAAQPAAAQNQAPLQSAVSVSSVTPEAPPVSAMLARDWQVDLNPTPYLVSEKLDGVRALWDGKTLRFRSGRTIAAPGWFVAELPKMPLDGELWIARRQFDKVSGAVRRASAMDAEWRAVRYEVFDLPGDARPFALRAAAIREAVQNAGVSWLHAVEHTRFADIKTLQRHLAAITAKGGEGLMLHHQDALWRPGRSDALRKLKAQPDEEGQVVAHIEGKGKFKGRMGALLLQMADGKRFALGSGFADAQRDAPPAIGSTVTYRFRDRTATGLPRFATFVRVHVPD